MPKYCRKQIFTHGSFPEVGQKQKKERKKEERERERLNDGNNNGQATHGARKHAWRMQAAWAKSLCVWLRRLYCKVVAAILWGNLIEKLFREILWPKALDLCFVFVPGPSLSICFFLSPPPSSFHSQRLVTGARATPSPWSTLK